MAGFLIDEDLPKSLSKELMAAGFSAEDVREVGLRGKSDREVLTYAVAKGLALITEDLGFSDILKFPLGSHAGILVARFPNELSVATLNQNVVNTVSGLSDDEIRGNLVIIEPGQIRIRRKSGSE